MRRLWYAVPLALLLVAGCDSDPAVSADVRVMSQNLYLGGDLFTVANEPNAQLIPLRVAELFATVQVSDPAARMAAIAAEIARVDPDLVGLQEVTTYYTQTPGDNQTGSPTPATTVVYDFLDLLLDALAAEGASYVVAGRVDNTDVEFPATTDGQTFFDVRYQDADVILARSDVLTSGASEAQFQSLVTIPVGGVDQTFVRSYHKVDATVDGLTFAFYNTHLEVGGAAEPIQVLQALQLRAALAVETGPTIVVGDINSDGNAAGESYTTLTTAFSDALAGGGATCCQDGDLRNDASELQTRIDVVLYRGFDAVTDSEVLFDDPSDRVGGIWPSDHAGVWAELSVGD